MSDFPCSIAEQNATQKTSVATQKLSFTTQYMYCIQCAVSDFPCISCYSKITNSTQYWHSVSTKYVPSTGFAMQNCWMKSFPGVHKICSRDEIVFLQYITFWVDLFNTFIEKTWCFGP